MLHDENKGSIAVRESRIIYIFLIQEYIRKYKEYIRKLVNSLYLNWYSLNCFECQ